MRGFIFLGVTALAALPATAIAAGAAKHTGTAKHTRMAKHAGAATPPSSVHRPAAASKLLPIPTPQLAALALRSTVTVYVYGADGKVYKSGSGFVIAPGLIATNVHVISGARRVTITAPSGNQREGIGLVCADQANDLAILYADTSGMPALPLADTSSVQIGQKVMAAGAPEGLSGTVSEGIVSSIRFYKSAKIFQTSAPISHGSSGGPLLDEYGRVIGITSFTIEDGQNLNFAYAAGYLDALRKSAGTGMLTTAWADDGIPDPEEDARLAKIAADEADAKRKQEERTQKIADLTRQIEGLRQIKSLTETMASQTREQLDEISKQGEALLADERLQKDTADLESDAYARNLAEADRYANEYNAQVEKNNNASVGGAGVGVAVAAGVLGGVKAGKFRKKHDAALDAAWQNRENAATAVQKYNADVEKGKKLIEAYNELNDRLAAVNQRLANVTSDLDAKTAELAAPSKHDA